MTGRIRTLRRIKRRDRRGATLMISSITLLIFLTMAAVVVDFGWVMLAKSELQLSADAAATAAAGELVSGKSAAKQEALKYVGLNRVGGVGNTGVLADSDIVFGSWDKSSDQFTPVQDGPNAVQVTVRRQLPLFFGPFLGKPHVDLAARATGVTGPRDIAFVIDLSGSMNNDTEIWATNAINNEFPGYPTIGTDIMSDVFADFGFGAYPGTIRHIAQPAPGAPTGDSAYSWLANTYLMNNSNVPSKYRVSSSNSTSTRKTKAYSWLIDYQLASLMPLARPVPNSSNSTSLAYWTAYLDYVIKPFNNLPPNQNSYRLGTGSNPYGDAWPSLGSSTYTGFLNKVGYQTYVQFMMDYGRTKIVTGSTRAQMSTLNADSPLHTDTDPDSPGFGLSFPPREQPTHAARLAILAAVNKIAQMNAGRPENAKDHVAIITYDSASGTQVRYPLNTLSCDYDAVKASVAGIQAAADDAQNTASENGLALAKTHLTPASNPSGARPAATKVVIFLSDGIANVKQSGNSTIDNFVSNNSDGEWFSSGSFRYERNAALMQAAQMQATGYKVFPVSIGLGADRTMMDRMARMADTAKEDPANPNGPKVSPYATGNPADYTELLTSIFGSIVGAPTVQLAK